MKRFLIVVSSLAITLAVAACGNKGGGGASACADAVGKGVDQMIAAGKAKADSMGSNGGPAMAQAMESTAAKLKTVMTNRCAEDKWPDDIIKCYAAATSMPALKECRNKLPPEQKAKVQQEIMQVMMAGGGMGGGMGGPGMGGHPGGAMPPPPPPAMGSGDSGSAAAPAPSGSGSAAPAVK